jgi:peptidoglycan hydrolase-like protein with peptidoglycan-binding domain
MNSERVREIQAALIREHYLDGEPNGVWDTRSKSAMQKFQADQGWQSKVVPDSRALIKLGLGPDHAGLLNPETAAIATVPGGGTPRVAETPEK